MKENGIDIRFVKQEDDRLALSEIYERSWKYVML